MTKPDGLAGAAWDVVHGYHFCSDDCTSNFFQKLKQDYIQKLKDLTDWGNLTATEQADFINQINTGIPGNFDNIIQKAKTAAATGGTNPLQTDIDQAMADIDDALGQDPEVFMGELDLVNRTF